MPADAVAEIAPTSGYLDPSGNPVKTIDIESAFTVCQACLNDPVIQEGLENGELAKIEGTNLVGVPCDRC